MISEQPQHHDYIDLSLVTKQGVFLKSSKLYENGSSLREISRQLGVSKTTVLKTLKEGGVALRLANGANSESTMGTSKLRSGATPYGYAWLNGELLVDAKETKVIQIILKHWNKKNSFNAIAKILNEQGIKPRTGKRWDHSVVNRIIKRHQNKKQTHEEK